MSQTSKERQLMEDAKSWIGEVISEGVRAIIEIFTFFKRFKDMNEMEQDSRSG